MINWKIQLKGTWTLLKKELLRFWRVVFQTVAA
ncbi:MAG: metal-dependent hydrolase, partial [Methylophilaceae bacterium]